MEPIVLQHNNKKQDPSWFLEEQWIFLLLSEQEVVIQGKVSPAKDTNKTSCISKESEHT